MNPEWIFITIGALALAYGVYQVTFGFLSRSWPSVRGSLDDCQVERHGNAVGKSARTETLRVRYSYEVNGKKYRGRRLSFGSPGRVENAGVDRTEEFVIRYCPWIHRFSVISPGVKPSARCLYRIRVVLFGAALA